MNRLLAVGAWTVSLLALAEVSARAIEVFKPASEDVRFDFAPYRMLRMTEAPFPLNRDGFRAAELDSYAGSFLIEFLGGSVCLGVGTNPGKPVPERLEEALHRAGMYEARVLNLCQGGTASAQELAILVQYGLPLKPQVVVSFNGANDLLHPAPMGTDNEPNLPYQSQQMQALFAGHHSWTEHLASKRLSDRLSRRLESGPQALPPAVAPSNILDSLLYITDIQRTLTVAQGGTFAWVLQPTLHYEKPWSSEEAETWKRLRPRDPQQATDYAHQLFAFLRTKAAAWSARTQTPLFDLTQAFQKTTGTVYTDSVHFRGDTGFQTLERQLEAQGILDLIRQRYQRWEESRPLRTEQQTISWRR